MQLRPYQQAAVDAVYEHLRDHDNNPCVVLPTGCHAAGHPILMGDGTVKPVEDIVVGDVLMGADSTPRNVLQLCRGEDDLYKITPNSGEPFVVNGDHVLSLASTCEGKSMYPCQQKGGEIENISVREYLKKSRSWRHLRKLRRVPVDFAGDSPLPIPPYILGLLLGDGNLGHGSTGLTTADEEIGQIWIEYARATGCRVTINDHGGRCPTYNAVRTRGGYNPIEQALHEMGLSGTTSSTKFIPHAYLTASRQDRLRLLAGLIDSDGASNKSGIDYISKSQELSADLVFLTRSLGFWAKSTQKFCTCQTGAGGWFFRVSIWGDFNCVPIQLKRRKSYCRRMKKSVLRTGFTVEPLGRGTFFGFTLDGDHLYVDGTFMVHHNSGKTPVIATICRDAVTQWQGRVLVLAHVKELLEQSAEKLQAICPDIPIGVYSAGLKRRDTEEPVVVARIQSAYRRPCELGRFDLILVDEAHLIPPDGEGMYLSFLKAAKTINPHVRVVGFTATPFRLKDGTICGPENILNQVCFEVGVKELIRDGYLSPLISRSGSAKADTSNLHIRAGEFVADEVEQLMDDDELVAAACAEIVGQTARRAACLIFCASVAHAHHVAQTLRDEHGIEIAVVTGDTPTPERDAIIAAFKAGDLRYLANVNVLTTGFDAPHVDCVALLRPTMSAGLYYQMVGRGFRLASGKDDCLVLDYGGNVLRHGPVDQLTLSTDDRPKGEGEAPAKECPECQALIATAFQRCPQCGYEFPPPERQKHEAKASTAGVLSGQHTDIDHAVRSVYYAVHTKRGADENAPKSLRVEYEIGWGQWQKEWVYVEHQGFARRKAEAWWGERSQEPCPTSAADAVDLATHGYLAEPTHITVRETAGEEFPRIVACRLGAIPAPREPGADEDEPVPVSAWADLDDEPPF
jgi:DNA repair protein RadD